MTTTSTEKKVTIVHGYVIQVWRDGKAWYEHEDSTHLAPKGQLPEAWAAIKADPQVVQAQIYSTTQRNKRQDKKKITEKYTRSAQQSA